MLTCMDTYQDFFAIYLLHILFYNYMIMMELRTELFNNWPFSLMVIIQGILPFLVMWSTPTRTHTHTHTHAHTLTHWDVIERMTIIQNIDLHAEKNFSWWATWTCQVELCVTNLKASQFYCTIWITYFKSKATSIR